MIICERWCEWPSIGVSHLNSILIRMFTKVLHRILSSLYCWVDYCVMGGNWICQVGLFVYHSLNPFRAVTKIAMINPFQLRATYTHRHLSTAISGLVIIHHCRRWWQTICNSTPTHYDVVCLSRCGTTAEIDCDIMGGCTEIDYVVTIGGDNTEEITGD